MMTAPSRPRQGLSLRLRMLSPSPCGRGAGGGGPAHDLLNMNTRARHA